MTMVSKYCSGILGKEKSGNTETVAGVEGTVKKKITCNINIGNDTGKQH